MKFITLCMTLTLLLGITSCGGSDAKKTSNAPAHLDGIKDIDSQLGGTVSIDDKNSPIFGAKIVLKPDTLDLETEKISIDYENHLPADLPLEAQSLNAVQASKTLVLTRTGINDLLLPAEVTLPYDKNTIGDNDVGLVMYWDDSAQKYSAVAMTSIDRQAGTITFRTAHFSKYVVITVKGSSRSLSYEPSSVDTGFRANTDGFFVHNFGTYDSPGGNCLGMANYSSWFFENKAKLKGVGLFSLYKDGDPSAEEDDQRVRELISRIFIASSQFWAQVALKSQVSLGDTYTGIALIQAMQITKAPQVLLMADKVPDGAYAHAVTVYGYDAQNKRFEIYDNNFPGEIAYLPWSSINGFGAYSKDTRVKKFGFDSWHSSFSPASMKAFFDGVENGWEASKFAKIKITEPAVSNSDENLLIATSKTNVLLAGQVPRLPGEKNPNAARYAHIFMNGINKIGVAPISDSNEFEFVIDSLPETNGNGTDLIILVSESEKRWQRSFHGFKQSTIRVQSESVFTLNLKLIGIGSVRSQPAGITCDSTCSADFTDGTNVTLTAQPANGFVFSGWAGSCSGASLTCRIGMTQAHTVTANFSPTSNAGWTNHLPVSQGGASNPKVAISDDGHALLIWQQLDQGGLESSVWASRFSPNTGWSPPRLLENNTGNIRDLQLAMDGASGKAMAIWQQLTSSSGYDVWARPFDPENGWGTASAIDNTNGSAGNLTLGADAGGNAIAVWSQLESQFSGKLSIYANRFIKDTGWGIAQLIEKEDGIGRQDANPSLTVAPNGDALTVWTGSGGSSEKNGIWTNRYTAGSAWGKETLLVSRSETGTFALSSPFIAGDTGGGAVLTFGQLDIKNGQSLNTLNAKRYQGGWQSSISAVAPSFNNGSILSNPYIKIGFSDAALCLWSDVNSTRLNASLGTPNGSWSQPKAISIGDRTVQSIPTSAIDNQGNAMVSWTQSNAQGGNDLWLAHYENSTGWKDTPERFNLGTELVSNPSLAINPTGNAVLAWSEYTSVGTQIIVRHYSSGR